MSVMEDLLDSQWGQLLLSDYHVVKCIHSSPMSEIFALESADGRTRLILKSMKLGIISSQMLETLKTTSIEGVVPIHDYHITENYTYVIKPYLDGASLQDSITQGLTIDTLLKLMQQLVKIVSNCHSQPIPIILRDIKPDNLMICDGQLTFFDMESSKLKVSTTASRDTVLLGTPGYAAPEQYGFQNSDERTDIYAIGQVMNCLLEHLVPAKSAGIKGVTGIMGISLQKMLLRSAKRIADRATSFDPGLRFQSAKEFKKTLEEIYTKFYMRSLAVGVMLVVTLFVGFQLPGVVGKEEVLTQVQSESVNIQGTAPSTEPTTNPTTEPTTDPTTHPTTEPSNVSSTVPTSKLSTELTEQSETKPAKQPTTTQVPTTMQAPTRASDKVIPDAQGMVEVRFTGNLKYAVQVERCNFLINMEGVTDPKFQKQFGNPVTLNNGLAQYSDISRSKMVIGDRYKITGYLDLNGNFSRDYHEPSEFISEWTFNGNQSQIIDFVDLVKDHQFVQETSAPGESDFIKVLKANFKVAQYGCSKDDFEILLSTFGVNGNGTGILRITQDHLKDIKLVVMANTRNEPISDYVQSALNAIGFSGGSGMSLGWFDNRFWIYFNANSSEEFKALIDKDRIVNAIGQK